ncbi:GDP/UDP-N,N'-diacetylbacillosamine 2-epimerase (hydrolysing) [Chitinophaga rupis]|uniref:GDP/UDP-N,N'-diacetylbacillosamine 2-epimerase (Hydrolysing) n=1 Tax=Chitinophaga rupis TaxID=573321 RepID=A0A1H7LN36_9BACT|nr:UDP-N-acetylglucosamine 2-epimerase [Chitinophaga rupis]SEL00269.1 GDP/UDP-N,N'-diacetylbacillosamine 2-epimerase (hydrolysing) [Chitinophaga rupis]
MSKAICIVTGTRAEYGLLYWTIKGISEDPAFKLQLVVTGMHLSPEFGLTYKQIEADGFTINKKVEILLSSDTPAGIGKSMGLGMIGFVEAFSELQPDIVLLLGDRFEIFSAAAAAMVCRIPIAHCHGGELTEGAIDEPIRHSVTKMAHLHFTATETFRNRVIQLGEHPDTVLNVGAFGIENINRLTLLNRTAFEESIGFKLKTRNILVTFHPVTLEFNSAERQFGSLLQVLDELEDTGIIFTKANADTEGRIINQMIDEFVRKNAHKAVEHTSLGQLRYLSALQYVDAVVGNSSSGLLEVPAFKKPTVNIGDRQRGRIKAASVIDCEPEVTSIKNAVMRALSRSFLDEIKDIQHPYGVGNASEKVLDVLRHTEFHVLLKKQFYDLNIKA